MSKYQLSKNSLRNLDGVNAELVDVVKLAIQITKIDFGIPSNGGYRTAQRQAELYAQGRTTPGNIITNADGVNSKSKHQTGKAVDVYAYVDGKASWDELHLSMVACAMLEAANRLGVDLRWGGLFKSIDDKPHFELRG